eukprot:TRINITY_DN9751_c0_g1_i1.p1 TRINITY_DN9751_c0_g1~~TRINITY_DN9751_c0_g1_i1.p1  ORF type:complete len:202 (+),score=35.59 TRINITY_DN9751_c0_g1_i1:195-800(+)
MDKSLQVRSRSLLHQLSRHLIQLPHLNNQNQIQNAHRKKPQMEVGLSNENDQATTQMGQMLLQGWTMMAESCPLGCHVPLMHKKKDNTIVCVTCKSKFSLPSSDGQIAPSSISKPSPPTVPTSNPTPTSQQSKPNTERTSQEASNGNVVQSSIAVLEQKLEACRKELEDLTDVPLRLKRIQKLSDTIGSIAESIRRLKQIG